MKTAGIIGGIGPESTIEYYRFLIEVYRKRAPEAGYPSILINSIDLTKALRFMREGELGAMTDYVAGEILRLAKAGADFAALSSNTPHIVFDELQRRSPIPMLSIVEATCREAGSLGLKRVGLFGTRYTMQARFYPDIFAARGISVVSPELADQTYIHDKYLGELLNNLFLPETREGFLVIVRRLVERHQVEGIILGGTELPLILRDAPSPVPFLDTTRIHVNAIVEEMLA